MLNAMVLLQNLVHPAATYSRALVTQGSPDPFSRVEHPAWFLRVWSEEIGLVVDVGSIVFSLVSKG